MAPPERVGPTQAEIAKAVAAGIDATKKGPSPAGLVLGIIAAALLAWAGLNLIVIESVVGNTIDEAFYNGVGVMCFGLAALSLLIGSK